MAHKTILENLIAKATNRRSFIRNLGIAGATASAITEARAATAPAVTDVDILNFALNLEYLDSEFYSIATSGLTLDQLGIDISGSGTVGSSTGARQLTFPESKTLRIAQELARDELSHVALIRSTIIGMGGQPIARPAMNYNALGFGTDSLVGFLKLAHIFEDAGVTAYAGSAASIQDKTVLTTSARILTVEAEHAAALRLLLYAENVSTPPLDGADIPLPPMGKVFSTNDRGLSEIRTPQEVLYIAYGGAANATSGGFFPNGVNGNIKTSSATPAAYAGSILTANPNPIPASGGAYGQTTLTWSAPNAMAIEIHVDSPDGPIFTSGPPSGAMQTGMWVSDGTKFYLQDASNGNGAAVANTLVMLTVTMQAA